MNRSLVRHLCSICAVKERNSQSSNWLFLCGLCVLFFACRLVGLVPPTLRAVPQNGQVSARKGSTVTLECKASGNPVPTIYWFKKVSLNKYDYIAVYISLFVV